MQSLLTLRAWNELLYMDLVGLRGFHAVQRVVTRTTTRPVRAPGDTVASVVNAMQSACALYAKETKCLQRSAVVTRLLRRRGVPAELVIGCRLPPLTAHAWVEVEGNVVSDYQDDMNHFRVIDRW